MDILPSRSDARRRDRHGRGLRGPVIPMIMPAWRTRSDKFDDVIAWEILMYREHLGERLDRYDVGVLDVPTHDPAPWEDGVPLARFFPFERPARIHGRLIFYRMPILRAAQRNPFPRWVIHEVVTSQIATVLDESPEDIDFFGTR